MPEESGEKEKPKKKPKPQVDAYPCPFDSSADHPEWSLVCETIEEWRAMVIDLEPPGGRSRSSSEAMQKQTELHVLLRDTFLPDFEERWLREEQKRRVCPSVPANGER